MGKKNMLDPASCSQHHTEHTDNHMNQPTGFHAATLAENIRKLHLTMPQKMTTKASNREVNHDGGSQHCI